MCDCTENTIKEWNPSPPPPPTFGTSPEKRIFTRGKTHAIHFNWVAAAAVFALVSVHMRLLRNRITHTERMNENCSIYLGFGCSVRRLPHVCSTCISTPGLLNQSDRCVDSVLSRQNMANYSVLKHVAAHNQSKISAFSSVSDAGGELAILSTSDLHAVDMASIRLALRSGCVSVIGMVA